MRRSLALFAVVAWLHLGTGAAVVTAEDVKAPPAEREGATLQVTWEQRDDRHVVRQYELRALGQWSYLLGSEGDAVVVDPERHVERYLADAEALGLRITKVVLTRTHTDFVAGHAELAARTGAVVLVGPDSGATFEHEAVTERATEQVGALRIDVHPAPGPTADGLVVYAGLRDSDGPDWEPRYALTGDALLVGAAGAPDTVATASTPSLTAALAFDTLRSLELLPDTTIVLPGHDAAARSNAPPSPTTTSTIGREKEGNPYLASPSRGRFVGRMLEGLAPYRKHAAHVAGLNRRGPPLLGEGFDPPPVLDAEVSRSGPDDATAVLDLRTPVAYARGHAAGSIHAPLDGPFETWVGTVVAPGSPILLVGSSAAAGEALRRLARIGYEGAVRGVVGDGAAWSEATAGALKRSGLIAVPDLVRLQEAWLDPLVVDVRSPSEYADGHLEGSVNVPLPAIGDLPSRVDPGAHVLFVCKTAYRSGMAVGLAERMGFETTSVLAGGVKAWKAAGRPVVR